MEEMKDFSEYPQYTTPVFRIGTFETSSMEDEEESDKTQKDLSMNDASSDQLFTVPDFENDEESLLKFPLTHQTVQMYYSNMGVNILPDIPEEPELDTEKEFESSMKNTVDPKRLSKISAALVELNKDEGDDKEKEDHVVTTDVLVKLSAVEVPDEIKSIEYIHDINSNENRTTSRDFDYSRYKCCQLSPYTIFKWRYRYRCLRDFIADYFLRPFCYSFRDFHFYPTLVSKVITLLISTIFITLAPYLFLKKNSDYKKEDTAFLLSYMAFSWCLFLVFLPLVITFSKVRMRYTFSMGLLFTAFSMLLLSKQKMTNDLITWSCLLYGFGFGMLSFSENFVYKSFLNETRGSEGTLDTLSGISVILAFYFIFKSKVDIVSMFPEVAFYCYVLIAGFWTIPSLMKICIIPWKEYRKK